MSPHFSLGHPVAQKVCSSGLGLPPWTGTPDFLHVPLAFSSHPQHSCLSCLIFLSPLVCETLSHRPSEQQAWDRSITSLALCLAAVKEGL
jgi:hypothetical protein